MLHISSCSSQNSCSGTWIPDVVNTTRIRPPSFHPNEQLGLRTEHTILGGKQRPSSHPKTARSLAGNRAPLHRTSPVQCYVREPSCLQQRIRPNPHRLIDKHSRHHNTVPTRHVHPTAKPIHTPRTTRSRPSQASTSNIAGRNAALFRPRLLSAPSSASRTPCAACGSPCTRSDPPCNPPPDTAPPACSPTSRAASSREATLRRGSSDLSPALPRPSP
jgi:hypothetical protein